ncbi:hypothetical protein BGX21_008763 [Mortierella sp. AD011]|nr:hypothetical protein BGX20_008341 [Mortierella sp. AD010]KAF9402779.1 hypothetical protein BGX21_008763 [Mortierella sp. AD011]
MATSTRTPRNPAAIVDEPTKAKMADEVEEYRRSINILILGETQSGKSTLVESMKKYSDPNVVLNLSAIGDGSLSHTAEVHETVIETNLPDYEVYRLTDGESKGESRDKIVHYGLLSEMGDVNAYEDAIDERKNLFLTHAKAEGAHQLTFRIYDTPGLDDTFGQDEAHMEKIFSALSTAGTIHLVLVVVGTTPLTPGLQDALRNYVAIFPEFNGIMAVVHTKIDYKYFHPKYEAFAKRMAARTSKLQDLIGRTTITQFMIDCDLTFSSKKPIRECLTRNTIGKILRLAAFNHPVALDRIVVKKSLKMKEIDQIIKEKYESIMLEAERSLQFKDGHRGDLLSQIYSLDIKIQNLEIELHEIENDIRIHNTDEMILLHEERYDQEWTVAPSVRQNHMEYSSEENTIDFKTVMMNNIKNVSQEGGETFRFWRANFERKAFQNGVFHVKLYAKKSNVFRSTISQCKTQICVVKGNMERLRKEKDQQAEKQRYQSATIAELIEKRKECAKLISLATVDSINPEVFHSLIQANAYSMNPREAINVVEDIYLAYIRPPQRPSGYPALMTYDLVSSRARMSPKMEDIRYNSSSGPSVFNILMIGDKESGKSALIKAIKNYDNLNASHFEIPSYTPTTEVTSTVITTSLPRFSVFEDVDGYSDKKSSTRLDNDTVRRYLSLPDGEYNLQKRRLHVQKDQLPDNPYNFRFQLIDTPGLDFTTDGSKQQQSSQESGVFVSKTLPAILSQLGPTSAVHLVLLVLPDVIDYADSIEFYQSILPALGSNTVYAYRGTKNDRAVSKEIQLRNKLLDGNNYADPVHILIDKLFIENDPIRACLARNGIRRILELALLNEPVLMQPKKPSFIKELDGFLQDRYFEVLKTIHHAIATTDESSPFHDIMKLARNQCDDEARYEIALSSPMKLAFSKRFENSWDAPLTATKFMKMDMESTEGEITQIDILKHNVEIAKQDGGKGTRRFSLLFRWTTTSYGVLDVRIYTGNTIHHSIDAWKETIEATQKKMTEAVQNAFSESKNPSNQHKLIMEFLKRYRHYNMMHRRASNSIIHPDAAQILSVCNIDQNKPIDLFECVERLEKAYLETVNASLETNLTMDRFQEHLINRRAEAPWTKIN